MKLVFIQPRYFNIWEALGIGYLAAWVREHCRPVPEMTFHQGYFDADETIVADAADADVVCFSVTSPTWRHTQQLAAAIKAVNPRARVVVGGWHPSAVPAQCLASPAVDQVIVGEGELALADVVAGDRTPLVQGRPLPSLDAVVPDRELIRADRTIDLCEELAGQRITAFQSCRVCPNTCTFCAEHIVTGRFDRRTNPIRERRPEHLLDEIAAVHDRYRLDWFKFVDATWNTSPAKVVAFCEAKLRRGPDLPWEANVHASFATREMLAAMAAAGCRQINVGCESGSQRILRDMRKSLRVAQLERVFAWAREVGLERRAFFLLGMPNETEADVRATEALVERLDPEVFGVTILCPYPGSELYDPAIMKDWDWAATDEYSNPYWHTEHFTNAELKAWQKRLTDRFHERLAWHHRAIEEPPHG